MKSPLISGNRTVEDVLREHLKEQRDAATRPAPLRRGTAAAGTPAPPLAAMPPATVPPAPPAVPAVTTLADYMVLENIECKDADGNVFEQYDTIYVRKDIERNADNSQKNFTPYQVAVYFEAQGLFLPSMALSCAIVAQLYQRRNDSAANALLMQYKDKGNDYGWHAQNTVIDYKNAKIIHYPSDANFPAHGGANGINQAPRERKELSFVKSQTRTRTLRSPASDLLSNCTLEDGLKNPLVARFVRHYTGLEDPSVLVDIGTYFQKPTRIWFPSNVEQCQDTRAAWLGCDEDGFDLNANDNLNGTSAARGVRLGAPAGRAALPGGNQP